MDGMESLGNLEFTVGLQGIIHSPASSEDQTGVAHSRRRQGIPLLHKEIRHRLSPFFMVLLPKPTSSLLVSHIDQSLNSCSESLTVTPLTLVFKVASTPMSAIINFAII